MEKALADRVSVLMERAWQRIDSLRHEWIMFVAWTDLLIASWPVSPSALAPLVPAGLDIDTFDDGSAWVSLVAFKAVDLHVHGLPPVPGQADFCELNCRTYVRFGGTPGVLFLSLDCPSKLATLVGKHLFHLPFKEAEMSMTSADGAFRFESRRVGKSERPAAFIARYRPSGNAVTPKAGTLEDFLTNRLSLFVAGPDGRLRRGDIAHAPWLLQRAEVTIEANTIADAAGLVLPASPPHAGYAARTDSLVYPLVSVAHT